METPTIISQIVSNLVGGIEGIAEGIGNGLSTLANSVFLTDAGVLSTFGTLVTVFAGVSLAIGLSRWVVNFVSSLGARNR